MTLRTLQSDISSHVERGWSLDAIDEQLIEPSRLSSGAKAAAWIWARAEIDRMPSASHARYLLNQAGVQHVDTQAPMVVSD